MKTIPAEQQINFHAIQNYFHFFCVFQYFFDFTRHLFQTKKTTKFSSHHPEIPG